MDTARRPADYADAEFVSLPVSAVDSGQRRLDGETYLTGGYGVRVELNSILSCKPLEDWGRVWQPPRLKGVLVSPDSGLPFLTATQVFDTRPAPRKFLAPSQTPNLELRFVDSGWILVTCSGSVGDVIVSYAPHLEKVISHDLLRLVPKDRHLGGYLYCFLRTRFGRTMLRSSQYGSIIKHLEPEHLFDVPVPTLPELYAETNAGVREIFALRDQAYELGLRAESIYSKQLGRLDLDFEETNYVTESLQADAPRRRLDGYYHNPSVRSFYAAAARRFRLQPLSDATRSIFGVPRFKHVYQSRGVPYLDSEDLFKVNPEQTKFIPIATRANAEKYLVQAGWLLMACSGQLYGLVGSTMLAGDWHLNKIVSNHVVRIVPKDVSPGYLSVALGHPQYGRPLVLRFAFGSEVPEISPDDLRQFELVRMEPSVEREIADLAERSTALRSTADARENALAALVEDKIDASLKTATH